MKLSRPKNFAAFTLIEIMIALTIFTMVMGSVIAIWRCIMNGKEVAERVAAAAQQARIGVKTVEDALTCTELSLASPQFYAFLTDTTSGKFASVSLAARLPSSFPGSGLFGDNCIRRVTFDVEEVNGVNNLIMNQSPLLEALNDQNTPYPITLARDVSQFMLEFWSPQDSEWIVSWTPTNSLPPMIRITLGVGHSADQPDVPLDPIWRTVTIPVTAHH